MRRILLTIGGVVQVLIIALHVAMSFGLAKTTEVPEQLKPLLHIFNAAVLTVVIFFAYVSLFRRRELIETPLGRATCWFVALFYLQRGLTSAFLRGVHLGDLAPMVAIAALYAVAALPGRPQREERVTASAPSVAATRA